MVRARVLGVIVFALALCGPVRTASAQEAAPPASLEFPSFNFSPALITASAAAAVRLSDFEPPPMSPIVPVRPMFGGRALMPSLFVSTVMVQALDLHSTIKAFGAGATEGNPLMGSVTQNRAAFIATKAAVATATILATHRIAKKNRVAAVVTLVAVNSAYAMIAAHNYNVAAHR